MVLGLPRLNIGSNESEVKATCVPEQRPQLWEANAQISCSIELSTWHPTKITKMRPGRVRHTCNFNILKLRQEDWFEFEISLDYIVCSRLAKATLQDPFSERRRKFPDIQRSEKCDPLGNHISG